MKMNGPDLRGPQSNQPTKTQKEYIMTTKTAKKPATTKPATTKPAAKKPAAKKPEALKEANATQTKAIEAGKIAVKGLKGKTKEVRDAWFAIGKALNIGRIIRPATKDYGKWVQSEGFGNIKTEYRSCALWLDQVGEKQIALILKKVGGSLDNASNPQDIRKKVNAACKELNIDNKTFEDLPEPKETEETEDGEGGETEAKASFDRQAWFDDYVSMLAECDDAQVLKFAKEFAFKAMTKCNKSELDAIVSSVNK